MMRLLVMDREALQPTRDGGAVRMTELLRLLREDDHDVTFATLLPWPTGPDDGEERLARLGVDLGTRAGALTGWLQAHGRCFDAVIASRLAVAEAVLPVLPRSGHRPRFIYDATHVEHLAKYRLAKLTGNRPLLAAALRDRCAERDVVTAAEAVLTTSAEDADELRELVPEADVHVVTAVRSDGDPIDGSPALRAGLVFLGFLGVPENELAVCRLVDRVWPLVEKEIGRVPLTVIGACPPEWLLAAGADRPGLTVTGHLENVDDALRSAAVLLVPLRGGAGVKTKVLHAFARHLPVVATEDGLRGIPADTGIHVLRAETDTELAAATIRILRDPALGQQLARRAAELLRDRFNNDVDRAALRAALGHHA